jgi:HlyD family secretion protein
MGNWSLRATRDLRRAAFLSLALLALVGCKPAPKIKASKATRAKVETTITTISSGTVDARQQAVMAFGLPARVSAVRVRVGDKVRKGQILAELDNSDLQKILRDARAEAQRAEKLAKEGLASQSVLDDALRAVEVARAGLDKSILKAPFDGLVTELNLSVGEMGQASAAGAKTPLRLVDLEPRIIKGSIDESDLGKVKPGNPARVRILAVRPKAFGAVVERVIPFVNTTREQDRTAAVEIKLLEGGAEIPVGASADIEIVLDSVEQTLAVPTRTLLGTGSAKYLYAIEDDKLKKTSVQLGLGNYDRTEVKAGVTEGVLVAYPADDFEMKDGVKVKPEVIAWP